MTHYKFAVSAWVWHGDASVDNYGFIDRAAEIGYDGIEIPTFDGNIDEKTINQKISSQSKKLEPIIVGGGSPDLDISSLDEKARKRGLEYIMKLVDKASSLGSNLVCGPLYSAVGKALYLTPEERKAALIRTAEGMAKAASYAEERGVRIALEPLCRYDSYLINTTDAMLEFLEMVNSDNVGVLLDTFHMNIEETSMSEPIYRAGNKFMHFQVCENDRGVPGKGALDWKEIARATASSGYNGWISLESFTPFEKGFSDMMRSWRPLDTSQDKFASDGLSYLKKMFSE